LRIFEENNLKKLGEDDFDEEMNEIVFHEKPEKFETISNNL
jgi:hypothetical protein